MAKTKRHFGVWVCGYAVEWIFPLSLPNESKMTLQHEHQHEHHHGEWKMMYAHVYLMWCIEPSQYTISPDCLLQKMKSEFRQWVVGMVSREREENVSNQFLHLLSLPKLWDNRFFSFWRAPPFFSRIVTPERTTKNTNQKWKKCGKRKKNVGKEIIFSWCVFTSSSTDHSKQTHTILLLAVGLVSSRRHHRRRRLSR